MKKKKGILKSKKKLTGVIVTSLLVLVAALGFLMPNNFKSILTNVRNVFAAGDEPVINKARTNNGDGTYKLSLSVKGDAEKKPQKANVIVVFDTSSSMNRSTGQTETTYTPTSSTGTGLYGLVDGEYVPLTRTSEQTGPWWNPQTTYHFWYDGVEYTGQRYNRQEANQSRLQAAQAATNSLANSLLSNNGRDGNPDDTIEIALVDFANTAVIAQAPTTDYDSFAAVVNSRDAGNNNRGTNWEAGFRTALNVNFNDNDPTYVIFVSDGNPTYYLQDPQNTQRGGTGGETTDNINTSYNQAVPAAQGVVNAGYNLYTIGIYGSVDRMEDITTDAGAPADHYYSAADTAALQEAFAEILAKIEMSGIGSAVINDGTTNQVSTSTGIVELLEVDENSYKYYKNGEEWTDPENDDEIAAHLVNGVVKWDLSKLGVLENDVTYEVTFDVYPSQTTYDYIADLENGVIEYSDLPTEVQKYLHQSGTALEGEGYSYSLDTNTEDVTLTYDDTRDEEGPQTIDFNKLNSVATTSDTISISKEWDNSIDSRTKRPVSVRILKTNDDGEFQNYCFTDSCTAELNQSNNWSLSDIHIATGLARLSGNTLTVLDTGHDYKFDELGSEAYNWELETETVHPMLINGVLTKLILVEEDAPDMGSDSYKTIDGKEYYKLDNGKVYVKSNDGANIKAENHRRSNLNIKKNVTGENANPNDKFEFTIKVTQLDENGDAIADDTTTINDDIWFSICDTSIDSTCVSPDSLVKDDSLVTGAQKEIRDGAWTGYYYTTNDSEVKVNLKDKYNIRFTNLISNTDFSVVESNKANYELDKIETTSGFESENDSKTIDKNAKKITGHIGENNTSYQVEYTNKNTVPETVEATVKKVWDDADNQDGKRPTSLEVTLSNGDSVTLNEGNNWTATVTGLPKYINGEEATYTWTEGTLPEGYSMTSNTTSGTITTITNSHTPEVTEVSGTKTWDDKDNIDGERPEFITVRLLANGDEIDSQTVRAKEDGTWSYSFPNLPKYENGEEINYTVTEDVVKYYTTEVDGYNITNTHTLFTTDVTVNKTWDDANNQDGKRPGSVTVVLKADGVAIEDTATLSDSNNWSHTWEDLDRMNLSTKQKIVYTVEELQVTDYTSDISDPVIIEQETETDFVSTWSFDVTNSHTPEETEATVKKVWDDANNQDGKRPASLEVALSNGTKVTLSDSNNWTDTVTGLPKYANGQEIKYSWTEGSLPEGYTMTSNTTSGTITTITNSYTPEETSATVKKVWDDANNQDGKRPASLEVALSNGTKVTLSDSNNWTDTVTGLPKYANGQEIKYSWTEGSLPQGYTMTSNTTQGTITTITNSHTPEETEATVKKVWTDANNQDGIRPGSLEVTLSNGDSVTLNASNGWTQTVTGLPKYANGQEITYTWNEESVPTGYELVSNKTEGTVTTITNKHTPEVRDVNVKKEWIDDGNSQNTRPTSVTVTLKANGETADVDVPTVTLNESNGWHYTWTGVDKKANGEDIEYTVVENPVANYDTDYDETDDGIVVINTIQDLSKDIPVEKVWDDDNDRDGLRPGTLKVTITGRVGDTIIKGASQTVTLSNSTSWKGTFTNLPVFNKGKLISYTIEEEDVSGYSVVEESTNTSNEAAGFKITNKHDPVKIKISGVKKWDDDENRDDARPGSITVNLLKNGQSFKSQTVTAGDDGNWSFEFDDLYKCEGGQDIVYTLTEETVDGYTAVIGQVTEDTENLNNYTVTVTNTHTPETITYKITKSWDDLDNNDGVRPASVTVRLKADGVEIASQVLNESNGWTYTFTNLPKYKQGSVGVLIQYTIVEDEVEGYDASFTDIVSDKTTTAIENTITNKHTPELHEDIKVTKTWVDENNKYGVRPEKITVRLYANGEEVDVCTLTAANGWTYTWTGLLKYKDGVEIIYTISEDAVRNYSTKIDGYNITNTYNGPHGEIVPPNTMVSGSALGTATNTSNGGNFSVLFLLILGIVGLMFRKEANN